jgi:hypothetical protein
VEHEMKISFGLAGLAAIGIIATSGSASAMPFGLATKTGVASTVEQVVILCEENGRCFEAPGEGRFGDGPRYDRRWDAERRHWRRDRDDWHRDHDRYRRRGDWRDDRRW